MNFSAFAARLRSVLSTVGQSLRLMVGLPSYDAYCAHMAEHHPDRVPMDFTTFFRDRQQARYGGGKGGRCC